MVCWHSASGPKAKSTAEMLRHLEPKNPLSASASLVHRGHETDARELESILDNSTAVIYVKDTTGRYLRINRRFEDLFGISRERVVGKKDYDLFPREMAERFRAHDQEVASTARSMEFEETALQSDGPHTYISIKFPLFDRAGVVYAVAGISTDITERKRAEEAVRRSQELFERLFESSPDAIMTADRNGRILAINTQMERMFGYGRNELVGQQVELLVPEWFRDSHPTHRAQYHAEPRVRPMGVGLDLYGRRKDGSEFPADIMLSPLEEEDGPLVLGVIRDVTERKKAQQALEQSEERFRQIAENLREVLFIQDLAQGKVLYASPAYEQIWGRPRQSLYDDPNAWIDAIHEDDRPRVAKAFGEHVGRGGVFQQEYRIMRPDGSLRWISDHSFPVPNEERGPARIVGIAEDITDRKSAEEALRQSEERFRLLVDGARDYAIFMLDPEGRVSSWNPGAERIKGYRAEEIIGHHFSEFFTREDVESGKPQSQLKRAAAEGQVEDEGWRVRKDGSRFWANTTLTALRDEQGRLRGFSKVTRDFTGRKRAEDALLLEVTNALVANLDADRLFAAVSASLRQVTAHEFASLALLQPGGKELKVQVLYSYGRGSMALQATMPLENSPAAAALASRQPLLVDRIDPQRYPSEMARRLEAEGLASACFLPLVSRDQSLGTLNVASRRESAFTHEEVRLLAQVANQIALAVDNALEFQEVAAVKQKLAEEKLYLEDELRTEYNFEEIVGESPLLKRLLKQVETVAPTEATVLILGETGTGKELIARAIHDLSARRHRTFVKLNCAAIPGGVLESELFGHEKGAFTGAIMQKIGRVELAHLGTLFLDEVGDIPLELQPKLLRVLQEKEFERLGSTRTIPVDVRLVAATNRDLARMVADHQFRSDLYYRLRVFPLSVPPLRERGEDIPLLVNYFAQKHAQRMNKRIETIPPEAMQALTRWYWPGNVRELENLIERAVILSRGTVLHVPLAELTQAAEAEPDSDSTTLEAAERDHILRALRESQGQIGGPHGAAARLGLKRTTLNSKMKKLGITRRDF